MASQQRTLCRNSILGLQILNWEKKPFIPYSHLQGHIREPLVRAVTEECIQDGLIEEYHRDEMIQAVLFDGLRIFGILSLLGKEMLLPSFARADKFINKSLDAKLPYEEIDLRAIVGDVYRQFYDLQWQFLAPIFERNSILRDLNKESTLPFLSMQKMAEGGFSNVYRLKLLGSHQRLVDGNPTEVSSALSHFAIFADHLQISLIRKELKISSSMKEDFENEFHVLSLLRVLKHPNIIRFYTAYSIENVPNLLFESAECDLKHFLYSESSCAFSQQDMLDALWGLASGLHEVHRYSWRDRNMNLVGCHYDLHPGNILVKDKSFLLSDFGLTRLKDEFRGSRSTFKGGVRDYYAPECQDWSDTFEADEIGRPSDIWSLGCIIAEILTFMQLGSTGVKEFAKKRGMRSPYGMMFTFHHGGEPNPEVLTWLGELEVHHSANEFTLGLGALVRDMLTVQQSQRPLIHQVTARLFSLSQRLRYQTISADHAKSTSQASFGLKVEFERLSIWASEVGLDILDVHSKGSSDLGEPQAYMHFRETQSLLQDIHDEIISNLKDDHPNINKTQHFTLRATVDKLWSNLSREQNSRMHRKLETAILQYEEIKDANVDSRELATYPRPQLLVGIKQALQALGQYRNQPNSSKYYIDQVHLTEQKHWNDKILARSNLPSKRPSYVLVEFMRYEDNWVSRSQELVARVANLVSLWHQPQMVETFPFLRCCGFTHFPSHQAYGLVFELPTVTDLPVELNTAGIPTPITLADVIERTQNRLKRPALEEIFMLAYQLASALASFHKALWLHKGISAYNVIFFPRSAEEPGDSLTSARLVGFSHSRENAEAAVTFGPSEDDALKIYRHPNYRRDSHSGGFREEYDYYSLGLVLLELGRWKLVKKMIKSNRLETASPEALREHLIRTEVAQLGSLMGSYYRDAVKACLEISPRGGTDPDPAQVWDEFEARVVGPLAKCIALYPQSAQA